MHLSQVEDRVPVLCDLFAVARLEGDLPLTVSHHKAIYTTSLPLKEDNLFRILKGFQFQQEFKLSMLVKSLKEHDEDERRNLLDHITQVVSYLKPMSIQTEAFGRLRKDPRRRSRALTFSRWHESG